MIPGAEAASLPKEFNDAILYVNASANLQIENQSLPWKQEYDEVMVVKNAAYTISNGKCWKDGQYSTWEGQNMEIQIECPEGISGTLLVCFSDYNRKNRSGILDFEGRESLLGSHEGDEYWVRFHVMREDSNDGQLILKTNVKTGGNLMVKSIILLN